MRAFAGKIGLTPVAINPAMLLRDENEGGEGKYRVSSMMDHRLMRDSDLLLSSFFFFLSFELLASSRWSNVSRMLEGDGEGRFSRNLRIQTMGGGIKDIPSRQMKKSGRTRMQARAIF